MHQYITKESINISNILPYEIKQHAMNPYYAEINKKYDEGEDDIITGSGEEDKDLLESTILQNLNHFWEPDDPGPEFGDYYDKGMGESL